MAHHFPGMDSNRFLMAASSVFMLVRSLNNRPLADSQHLKRLEIFPPLVVWSLKARRCDLAAKYFATIECGSTRSWSIWVELSPFLPYGGETKGLKIVEMAWNCHHRTRKRQATFQANYSFSISLFTVKKRKFENPIQSLINCSMPYTNNNHS